MDNRTYIPNTIDDFKSYEGEGLSAFPLHVDIELSSRCNLNCVYCGKQHLLKPGYLGDMSMELFCRIVDQCAAGGVESIGLSYRGEPLLNRQAPEMVAYAKKAGIDHVSFCSNGMLLVPVLAEKLIRAGLDEITVSAQGATAESFEHSRIGANFAAVVRNVDAFMKCKKRLGVSLPKLRIQAVELPELDKEGFLAFWTPRCDEVVTVAYRPPCDGAEMRGDWCCSQLWRRMTVEWDGCILPCNNNDLRTASPGNANEISLGEAWTAPCTEHLRTLHRQGRGGEHADCRVCTFRATALSMPDNA